MTAPKVTFLFGAGASNQALPIVSEIPGELKTFRNRLLGCRVESKHQRAKDALLNDVNWLIDTLDRNKDKTIDTVARELWHAEDSDINARGKYRKLKTCLSLFFLFMEKLKGIDCRYHDFYLKILLKGGYRFPANAKILTWNYDSQLEAAYAQLAGLGSIEDARVKLGVLSKDIFPRLESTSFGWMPTAAGTNIFKLNGTASVFHVPTGEAVPNYILEDLFDDICDKYNSCHSDHSSAISFNWDKEETRVYHKGVVNLAIEATHDTEVLVIIGYSIPWYNKETDYRILRSMSKLSRILIQDPFPEKVRSNLHSLIDYPNVRCNSETKAFDLPVELLDLKG